MKVNNPKKIMYPSQTYVKIGKRKKKTSDVKIKLISLYLTKVANW